jgi:protein-S-isoprenylcysteine O-methyltransferase Ste14
MATPPDAPTTDSTAQPGDKIHEVAGGWITERVGTPIPLFLKLSYVALGLFGLIYLFRYRLGEIDNAARGPLVQQFNQVSSTAPLGWIVFLGVILFAFVAGLLLFAFRSKEDPE